MIRDSAPLPMVSPDEKVFIDLKEKISTLSERGVTIFFLPPPYCRSSFQNDSLAINRISESLKAIGFPYYLEPSGCVYPDSHPPLLSFMHKVRKKHCSKYITLSKTATG